MTTPFTLFFKTLGLICCIQSIALAQQTWVKKDNNKRSLWIGVEMLRSIFIFDPDQYHDLKNKAYELNIEYSLNSTYRVYVYGGYAYREGKVRQNLNYWSASYYTRIGIKVPDPAYDDENFVVGLGLIYYASQEIGRFEIGGPYFGAQGLLPYNIWFSGIGPEIVGDVKFPLFGNLEFRFDFSMNVTFNPALSKIKNDPLLRNSYYLPGVGLWSLKDATQFNLNLGISLVYHFDWHRKK